MECCHLLAIFSRNKNPEDFFPDVIICIIMEPTQGLELHCTGHCANRAKKLLPAQNSSQLMHEVGERWIKMNEANCQVFRSDTSVKLSALIYIMAKGNLKENSDVTL